MLEGRPEDLKRISSTAIALHLVDNGMPPFLPPDKSRDCRMRREAKFLRVNDQACAKRRVKHNNLRTTIPSELPVRFIAGGSRTSLLLEKLAHDIQGECSTG